MLTIEGSRGEGGGQVLRSALALSTCTGIPFRIVDIRGGRQRPGLRAQHLTAVLAASKISGAEVTGAALDSRHLTFVPNSVRSGRYRFTVGTAGSTTLVLQTVLPALLAADGPSRLVIEGGTHNPQAPAFECVAEAFLPLIRAMGPDVQCTLDQAGFYPAGGGRIRVAVEPLPLFEPLQIPERGLLRDIRAEVILSKLPKHVAERESGVVSRGLEIPPSSVTTHIVDTSPGPGNAVIVRVVSEHVTEVFAAFGRPGVPAERVAGEAVERVKAYLDAEVPVGPYLADQLLLPLALAGGVFDTMPPTSHTSTNAWVIDQFLPGRLEVAASRDHAGAWTVRTLAR